MRQPWLQSPDTTPTAGDDFSPRSATRPVGAVALTLGLVLLLLAMGRSAEIVEAAYGLPLVPGTEGLIAIAEGWDGWMAAIGVKDLVGWLREVLAAGRS